MSTESKTPKTPEGTTIAPCPGCGKDIPTRNYIRVLNDDGTYGRIVASATRCEECEAKHKKLVAESRLRRAEAKAKYEKSLADLLNSVPKKTEQQIGFDMGLD